MGRDKRSLPSAVVGGPKERHRRLQRSQFDPHAPVPEGFVAKPAVPKSKHHTYFEFVENKNKKRKLEFKITTEKQPPPGFEFVPIGNPQLTTACKEISRERDAMIFIVSNAREAEPTHLASQIHRMGHHIRETIVEEAKAALSHFPVLSAPASNGDPEPIPDSQEEYYAQVDPAIRDLFPRIPNTDREMIIAHSFTRGAPFKEEQPVGLCADITLARRVQLAVLAHIRHVHTRYDELLKETTWQNARKVVESLCLDTLVKWRGDEETGRDQLDEILREVVVISDSEAEDSDAESTDDTSVEEIDESTEAVTAPTSPRGMHPTQTEQANPPCFSTAFQSTMPFPMITTAPLTGGPSNAIGRERNHQRGFKRYRAWEQAIRRHREREMQPSQDVMDPAATMPQGHPAGWVAQPRPPGSSMHCTSDTRIPPGSRPQHRAEDVPVPSIEPVSPRTMPPAFVRSIPPRIPLEVNAHSQRRRRGDAYDLEKRYEIRTSSPYRQPPGGQVPVSGQEVPHYVDVPSHGHHSYAQSFQSYTQRQVYREAETYHVPNPARRIVMDAPRPGTRSNPIVMEDRGGFYERVPAPQDPWTGHGSHPMGNSTQLEQVSTMPPLAPPRGEAPQMHECQRIFPMDFSAANQHPGPISRYVNGQASAYGEGPQPGWGPAPQIRAPVQAHPPGPSVVYTEYPSSREEVRHSGWETEEARFTYQQTRTYRHRQPEREPARRQGPRLNDHGDVIVLE